MLARRNTAVIVALLATLATSWSVPGLIPRNYHPHEKLDLLVGQLRSPRTAIEFDYYSLNWCNNTQGVGFNPELRGMSLRGTPMIESPYSYSFDTDKNWVACYKTLTQSEI